MKLKANENQTAIKRISERGIYALVMGIAMLISSKFPNLNLPTPDTINEWVITILSLHGAGDITKVVKEIVQNFLNAKNSIKDSLK